ncbi:MAG: MmcQ/YjbR family DNA-binding protein [Dehalococcoidia bacterium]
MATEDEYRRIALSLPEVIEENHYGSPSFKVGKTFLSRLREDGENVVLPMPIDERDFWIEQEPNIFHVTEHYQKWAGVLVRLAEVEPERLEELLHGAWLHVAKPAVRKRHPELASG